MTRRTPRHIWLVMANDWPERCFATEALADDFCAEANARDRVECRNAAPRARVYYKWYKLEVLA